jgi:hypothetical protein
MNWIEFIKQNFINSNGSLFHFISLQHNLDRRFLGIFDKIISETSFLPYETLINERLYCLYNNITKRKICEFCNINFLQFIDFKRGYCLTCSKDCYKKFQKTIQDNGKTVAENRSLKSAITKKSGRNYKKQFRNQEAVIIRRIRKDPLKRPTRFVGNYNQIGQKISTIVSKVGDDGLTGYERGKLNGSGKCKVLRYDCSNLYFQGSLEKHFLDMANEIGLLDLLKNGPIIKYNFQNTIKTYKTDFICNNLIFEIKSIWTYDARGRDSQLRLKNNLKFKTTLENGFRFILIHSRDFYVEVTLDKLKNIQNDLLSIKNNFNKEVLKNIINEIT